MDACSTFLRFLVDFYSNHPFIAGVVIGVAAILLLFLLLCIVRWLHRTKSIPDVSYETKRGRVSIRASAITGLVESLKKDFQEFSINKIQLLRKGKEIFLLITVDFRLGSRPFPEVANAFEDRVIIALSESFGVKNIQRVELCMRENLKS